MPYIAFMLRNNFFVGNSPKISPPLPLYSIHVCKKITRNFDGILVTGIGWGSTNRQASTDRLREAHVPIIGHERCSTSDYWGNITQPDMICAGDQNTGACFGDSGGPLVCNDNGNHEYQLVGITSFVAVNNRPGQYRMCRNKVTKPSVFTRVHSYKDWIQSHLHRLRMRELEDQMEALQRQMASFQVWI